jgi:uncharacterized protein (TIGR03067 family)
MLAAPLLLALALVPADAPTPPPDAAVSDAGDLRGEWEVVGCIINGGDETSQFKGDSWRLTATSAVRLDATQGQEYRADVRVGPAADPPAIDLTNSRGQVRRGIYRRAGDELIWAMNQSSGPRPSSFDPALGVVVWTLRRVKK